MGGVHIRAFAEVYCMAPPRSGSLPDTSWSLLRSVQDGSPEGWRRIVDLYAPVVARWCRRWGLQAADVENVLQDVFLTVARHLATFRDDRGSGRFRAWLSTITRSRLSDHHRRAGREPAAVGGDEGRRRLEELAAPGDDGQVDPVFRDLELRRALDLVRVEVAPSTWDAFWQTAVEGRTAEDAAAVLGLSPGAVRLAKLRVLRRLRRLLG
jgi:RNA polymerase sigma-70 factor (ECF subfamily)